jgi:predicted nuclease with TOPRIM domain
MLASTELTHSEILKQLHVKEMEAVTLAAERDTLKGQLEAKIVENERLKENTHILKTQMEHRDDEIHELTRDKNNLEEHSKKALALAIQQLGLEVKAKEMHEDSVKKLIRSRQAREDQQLRSTRGCPLPGAGAS